MIRKYTVIILSLIVLSACGIKRDNPLDPHTDSNIVIPGDITGLQCEALGAGTSDPFVRLTWNSSYNADGYFIYRSLGYNSFYALIDTTLHVAADSLQAFEHSSVNDPTVTPGVFWYRISAYKDYDVGRLEGRLSEPKYVRIGS